VRRLVICSPTCFGTSNLPSSGSFHSYHKAFKMSVVATFNLSLWDTTYNFLTIETTHNSKKIHFCVVLQGCWQFWILHHLWWCTQAKLRRFDGEKKMDGKRYVILLHETVNLSYPSLFSVSTIVRATSVWNSISKLYYSFKRLLLDEE
jgi:hypothetical protein